MTNKYVPTNVACVHMCGKFELWPGRDSLHTHTHPHINTRIIPQLFWCYKLCMAAII